MRGQLIKRYFITGLLIWVPLVITGWVLSLIVSTLDQSLRLLPTSIHPQTLLGFAVPGAGAVLKTDVNSLTRAQREQIERRVAHGERIRF